MVRVTEGVVFISNKIEIIIDNRIIYMKGQYGTLIHYLHDVLDCKKMQDRVIVFSRKKNKLINSKSILGTTCSLLRSMLIGVDVGFTKKLHLIGVGYRASLERNFIILNVGFSHVVNYKIPDSVRVTCPTPVDIVLNSANKQLIGQVAADLRAIRPPEPFTGKGIRYEDEILKVKEVKKK